MAEARVSSLPLTDVKSVSNALMSDRSVVCIVMLEEPSNELPAIFTALANADAVLAFPVRLPVKPSTAVIPPALMSAKSKLFDPTVTVVVGSVVNESKKVQGSPDTEASLIIPANLVVEDSVY